MTFFDPAAYVILPWTASRTPPLPDHLRCTYELVVSLAYSRDRCRTPPVTRRELAAWRGLAVRTIDEHLAALRQRGLIRNDPSFDGACLVLELVQPEDLPESKQVAEPTPAAAPTPAPSPASSPTPAARPRHPLRSAADLEEEATIPSPTRDQLLTSQALLEAGVYHGVAQRIAHLPWVTPDLVRRWKETLARQREVRHVGALLASTLGDPQRCFPAPELVDAPEDDPPEAAPAYASEPRKPPARHIGVDWSAVLQRLEVSLGDKAVKLWFARARPVSQGEGGLVVAMGSPRALDWVSARYLPELQQALDEVHGAPLPLHLVLRG